MVGYFGYLQLDIVTTFVVTIFTAGFTYWLTTKKHTKLKKMGLEDGIYIDVRVMKAGGQIVSFSTNGYDFGDMISNVVKSVFGGNKQFKDIVNTKIQSILKDAVTNKNNSNFINDKKVNDYIKNAFDDAIDDLNKSKVEDTKA